MSWGFQLSGALLEKSRRSTVDWFSFSTFVHIAMCLIYPKPLRLQWRAPTSRRATCETSTPAAARKHMVRWSHVSTRTAWRACFGGRALLQSKGLWLEQQASTFCHTTYDSPCIGSPCIVTKVKRPWGSQRDTKHICTQRQPVIPLNLYPLCLCWWTT